MKLLLLLFLGCKWPIFSNRRSRVRRTGPQAKGKNAADPSTFYSVRTAEESVRLFSRILHVDEEFPKEVAAVQSEENVMQLSSYGSATRASAT